MENQINPSQSVSGNVLDQTGQALIDACQSSPHRDVEIAPERTAMPVRAVVL